jgi:hypothetical protein
MTNTSKPSEELTGFEKLVEIYANGKPICNCGQAYYSPCGEGYVNGQHRKDLLCCKDGCSANLIDAKELIADQMQNDIKRLEAELAAARDINVKLRRYVDHKQKCSDNPNDKCTCGVEELLR